MKKTSLFLLLIYNFSLAQDSLYTVFSMIGSLEEPISAIDGLGDLNHDGYDDFIIRKENTDYCEIYFGGENIDLTYTLKLFDQPNMESLGTLINVGDLNGDGYDDYAQNGFLNDGGFPTGKVFVFYGNSKFDATADWEKQSFCIDGLFGSAMSLLAPSLSGGDINGDGINDLVIGEPYNWCDGIGRVHIFYGGDSLSSTSDTIIKSKFVEDSYGEFVSADADINGDGFNDVIVSAPNSPGNPNVEAKVFIYRGSSSNINIVDSLIGLPSLSVVRSVNLKDFNGDGFDDFYVTYANKLFFGSSDFSLNNFLQFSSNENTNSFGGTANPIGDINSDGFSDFLIADGGHINENDIMVGASYIDLGNSSPDTNTDFFLEGETKWSGFGGGGLLGDINGDGFMEFFVSAFKYPDVNNKLGKIYVYSMKKFIVGVDEEINTQPHQYVIEQNYPNPFNPSTTIKYQIPADGMVSLRIYDITGQEVKTLVNEAQSKGRYEVNFDASSLSSGVYFYRLQSGSFNQSMKMILLK